MTECLLVALRHVYWVSTMAEILPRAWPWREAPYPGYGASVCRMICQEQDQWTIHSTTAKRAL